jgi:hypothetical protein
MRWLPTWVRPAGLLLALALAGGGCGSTRIITNDPRARIFADGEMIGQGQGEITLRGPPGGTSVVVATEDGRRQSTQVRRKFTASTAVLGLFTYGVCLLACWEYPSVVYLPIEGVNPYPAYGASSWDPGGPGPASGPAADPWMQPPAGYQPRR